jgi:hypothetical protein
MKTITDAKAKHLFQLEVKSADVEGRYYIEVEANTRSKARIKAENHGYEVCSVNMVG